MLIKTNFERRTDARALSDLAHAARQPGETMERAFRRVEIELAAEGAIAGHRQAFPSSRRRDEASEGRSGP
jgi:hypothetical protein